MPDLDRRRFLRTTVAGAATVGIGPAFGQAASGWPGKRGMIVQRVRPPLLETPLSVFDGDVFTPNDRFFVRWHLADIPPAIDATAFRLRVGGHVARPLSLSLAQLLRMPRVALAAVNQCSGNSRALFGPRIPGAQWGHGAMGNANWLGVPLRHVLDLAGVRPGAVQVRCGGLDKPLVSGSPDFLKSLDLDHARDGEVMIAFAMNGAQLPLLNGFPLRLVVPGWFSTYWVKMLDSIEVLSAPDENYWMAKAYRVPTAPGGNVAPGTRDFATEPISRMIPRSWITSVAQGQRIALRPMLPLGGIAMGGDCGVARVGVSSDGGRHWVAARLGPDHGRYSFRRWDAALPLPARGPATLLVRCWNTAGIAQPLAPIWNPGGYLRGNVEAITVTVA